MFGHRPPVVLCRQHSQAIQDQYHRVGVDQWNRVPPPPTKGKSSKTHSLPIPVTFARKQERMYGSRSGLILHEEKTLTTHSVTAFGLRFDNIRVQTTQYLVTARRMRTQQKRL